MGTHLELLGNQKQSNNPTLYPTRKKNRGPPGGMLPHLIGWKKFFGPICVICHFWPWHELWVYIGNGSDPRHPALGRKLLGRAIVGAFSKYSLFGITLPTPENTTRGSLIRVFISLPANFRLKEKLRIKNLKMKWFWRVSIAKSDRKLILNRQISNCWFSVCSHEYRKLITTFALHIWFIDRFGWILVGWSPFLAICSNVWSPLRLP
jgi:hypothetical protein